MEGINIMPGSIRPVSANCVAGMELKEAMGCKIETESEREKERSKGRRVSKGRKRETKKRVENGR